jgi:cytochrome o ubiquinol oxidase subunit IV
MSNISSTTETKPKIHHGTVTSYVVGFVLSLIFTLIPYYLVTQKTLEGNMLISTIIGFAVLQLIVQVVFFLHLGREKKPHWNLIFLLATVGIILLVVVGSLWIMDHLHYNMSATDVKDKVASDEGVYQIDGTPTGTCQGGTGENYKIELKDGKMMPAHVDAKQCDTLTIINLDDAPHDIKFGSHEMQRPYAGEDGKTIRPGRNMILTLTELGAHELHDHMKHDLSGSFTVTR